MRSAHSATVMVSTLVADCYPVDAFVTSVNDATLGAVERQVVQLERSSFKALVTP